MGRLNNFRHRFHPAQAARAAAWLCLSVFLLAYAPGVRAMDADQKAVYEKQVFAYDVKDADVCSGTGSIGATGNSTITTDLASFVDAYGQIAFDVGKANGIPYDAI